MTFSRYHAKPTLCKDCNQKRWLNYDNYNLFLTNPASSRFQKIERSCWLMDLVENTHGLIDTEACRGDSGEETMDHVKNKHGLMNTRACRKTVHLLENMHGFKNTRSTLSTTGGCRIHTCESFVRAWPTEKQSLRFHMWLVGSNPTYFRPTLLDITNHLLISDCISTS